MLIAPHLTATMLWWHEQVLNSIVWGDFSFSGLATKEGQFQCQKCQVSEALDCDVLTLTDTCWEFSIRVEWKLLDCMIEYSLEHLISHFKWYRNVLAGALLVSRASSVLSLFSTCADTACSDVAIRVLDALCQAIAVNLTEFLPSTHPSSSCGYQQLVCDVILSQIQFSN